MPWADRNVFVTGASGLLGSWLVQSLIERGANVVCLVRDWIPSSRLVGTGLNARAVIVRGELEDLALLTRAINEYEIHTVFHLGAQTIVGTAARSPLSTFETNIRGTWNLLEACKTCAKLVQAVVVASSDKAYGEHAALPYTETMPLQGRYPYDVSKSCADLISLSYYHTWRLPVAITRCANLYGGGDLNYNRVIPGTIRSALCNERPAIRSDGTYIRDYFYVRDAADAYIQLAECLAAERRLAGEAFNFGTETPLSVLEIVRLILKLSGKTNLEPVIRNTASHEIPAQYLDCTKARETLGWKYRYTIEEGLSETIAWYERHLLASRTMPCTEAAY